jgi:hypothetical protein
MKITTVSYQRTYNLGSYNSEKIGLEASIDEGEDIQFVVCNLKHDCDEIHKKNNPQLYQEQTPIQRETIHAAPYNTYPPEGITQPEEKISAADEENNLITSIESAQNEQELIQYKLLAAKNIKTLGSYKKRAKQLNLE